MASAALPSIEGVDFWALLAWMDGRGIGAGPIDNVESLIGGTQNILVGFNRGSDRYVLRRPPLHKRPNSDETMRREARVLGAIAGSPVPHPRLIAACPETETLGAAFYLMTEVDGFNIGNGLPELHAGDDAIRERMGHAMVEAIVHLADVDWKLGGLVDFGKPDGWLERQVPRWRAHLDGYSAVPEYPGPDIPGVDDVGDWLDRHRPTEWQTGIIHGDFHLNNVMFRHDSGELAAVVDWELATIGDPMMDLGWLMATWPEPGLPKGSSAMTTERNLAPLADLIAYYGELSTRDVNQAQWYGVMACYKLGIILEGTHVRALAGRAPTETGDALHAHTVSLFERAQTFMAQSPP